MNADGMCYFYDDLWNYVDIGCFLFFMIYFINEMVGTILSARFDIYFKCLIIVTMGTKLDFFLRVYKQYGLLVNLITTCVKDIIPFTIYLFTWQLYFVMLYTQSGIIAPDRQGLGNFSKMLLYVWENSIGNINDPEKSSFNND